MMIAVVKKFWHPICHRVNLFEKILNTSALFSQKEMTSTTIDRYCIRLSFWMALWLRPIQIGSEYLDQNVASLVVNFAQGSTFSQNKTSGKNWRISLPTLRVGFHEYMVARERWKRKVFLLALAYERYNYWNWVAWGIGRDRNKQFQIHGNLKCAIKYFLKL